MHHVQHTELTAAAGHELGTATLSGGACTDACLTAGALPKQVKKCLSIKGAEDAINKPHAFEISTVDDSMFFIADNDKVRPRKHLWQAVRASITTLVTAAVCAGVNSTMCVNTACA